MTDENRLPAKRGAANLTSRRQHIIASAIDASMSANTRATYRLQWELFERWCEANGKVAMPASPDTLADYLASLVEDGRTVSSIQTAKAAIAKAHVWASHPSPITEGLRAFLRGLKREASRPRQAVPIRWPDADTAAQLAAADGTIAGLRDAAIIAVMSDAMLRISECAALEVTDLEAEAKGTVLIRRSKTDQEATGAVLPLRVATVKRVRMWLAAGGIEAGPMFRQIRRGGHVRPDPLRPQSIRLIVRARARAAGIEGNASGHSLRVGGAQSYAAAGASLVEMQLAGRWDSPNMPAKYARGELATRGPLRKYRGK